MTLFTTYEQSRNRQFEDKSRTFCDLASCALEYVSWETPKDTTLQRHVKTKTRKKEKDKMNSNIL